MAERLTRAGATVTHHVLSVGHAITAMDREIARNWLAEQIGSARQRNKPTPLEDRTGRTYAALAMPPLAKPKAGGTMAKWRGRQ
jgi:hypothetical protein